MSTVHLIEYAEASPEVRAVYDDIRAVRNTDFINNFWQALANNPAQLQRTWDALKAVMVPGALDMLTKELIYIAVSATNSCAYCTHSHTASARASGMTNEQYAELMSVVGMAHHTNSLATVMQVPVDHRFRVAEDKPS